MSQDTANYTVITGASAGIGAAAARAFAARGHNLVLIARRTARLNALREELLAAHPTLDIIIKTADLSDPDSVMQVYHEVKGLPLRTWINNAGFGSYGAIGAQDLGRIRQMIHLNIEALTMFSSLFVRDFADIDSTQLINISSVGGYLIVPSVVTYCATKFYVSAFTEGLAQELAARGAKLRAKLLAPAATQTEFGAVARWQNSCSPSTTATPFSASSTARRSRSASPLRSCRTQETRRAIRKSPIEACLPPPSHNAPSARAAARGSRPAAPAAESPAPHPHSG